MREDGGRETEEERSQHSSSSPGIERYHDGRYIWRLERKKTEWWRELKKGRNEMDGDAKCPNGDGRIRLTPYNAVHTTE